MDCEAIPTVFVGIEWGLGFDPHLNLLGSSRDRGSIPIFRRGRVGIWESIPICCGDPVWGSGLDPHFDMGIEWGSRRYPHLLWGSSGGSGLDSNLFMVIEWGSGL